MDASGLTLISTVIIVLAALANGRAALLARPVKPELGQNLWAVVAVVKNMLQSVSLHAGSLRKGLLDSKSTSEEALSASLLVLDNISRSYQQLEKQLNELKPLDYTETELGALSARTWIEIATFLALASGGVQLFLLFQQLRA